MLKTEVDVNPAVHGLSKVFCKHPPGTRTLEELTLHVERRGTFPIIRYIVICYLQGIQRKITYNNVPYTPRTPVHCWCTIQAYTIGITSTAPPRR